MQLQLQPRLQAETFSLYWKEPTKTETKCLDAFTLTLDAESTTVASLMDQVRAVF